MRSKPLGDFRVFKVRSDVRVSPRTGEEHDFFVLDAANWVNVLALTPERQLILVEQYRHGSDTVELEIPGGVMDPQDGSPVDTGVRELREETGYEGRNARIVGEVWSNPAIMTNKTFTVLIEDCELRHRPAFDSGEDLVTRLAPVAEVPKMAAAGKFKHSLVVVALYMLDLWLRGLKK